jgi:DNA-binding NarL/FixJ family response regulator
VQQTNSRPELSPVVCRSLGLLASGLLPEQVAVRLGTTPDTIRGHVAEAMAALGATSKLGAVWRALQLGLIELPEAD